MINIFVALFSLVSLFTIFNFSFRINGLNRTIINVPLEIFNISLYRIDDKEIVDTYFLKEYLEPYYEEYLSHNIYKYVESYSLDYRYYFPSDDSICLSDCKGVEIEINAKIFLSYSYHRIMFYELREL